MPYLMISTNVRFSDEQRTELLSSGTELVSSQLGKPPSYVMVHLRDGESLVFGGSDAPASVAELASLGLPEGQTAELSRAICELITRVTGIASDRIYIDFRSPPRHMWGYDGRTFG